jgi:SanA protein
MSTTRGLLLTVGGLVVVAALVVGVPNAIVILGAGGAGHDPEHARHAQVALIPGASAYTDGTPTPILADRLAAGAALYRDHRVDRVLVSGKPGRGFVDQIEVMRRELVRMGVPDAVIFTDRGGLDTWDTMVRAHKVYEVSSAIVVTQGWHMPRALWLAKQAGIKAHGLIADRSTTARQERGWGFREIFARVKAVGDVVTGSKPAFLGPKIPITGSAEASRG